MASYFSRPQRCVSECSRISADAPQHRGGRPLSRIVNSPLQRCRIFAEQLTDAPLHVDERLREVGFGVWEGRLVEEVGARIQK